jgi:Holliday junction resolvase RusA-like endonuclease
MTKKGKEYKEDCAMQAGQQYKKEPLSGPLEVTYKYFFKDKRVRDHLNFNKALNDSLNGIIWEDDKQIKTSHHYTKK